VLTLYDIASPDVPAAFSGPMGQIENAFKRLTNAVKEISQAELEYLGPAGNKNAIATILGHLALTDIVYLHAIMGVPEPPELQQEFGPYFEPDGTLPKVAGKTAAELLERYQGVIDRIRDYLKTQTDSDAERVVKVAWWSQPATVRYVLWHIAGHSMLHQGQIARLRLSFKESTQG
jgi:uncharacterized damage-inducible protein DinB